VRIEQRDEIVGSRAANPSERGLRWRAEDAARSGRETESPVIAVVIPCYRVRDQVLDVIRRIPSGVSFIFCVDDHCPDASGCRVTEECRDPRVRVITHDENQGVGGATVTGYYAALAAGADVVVKVDGDGQMDPALIPRLVQPIADRNADYTKGNRFYRPESLHSMPLIRLAGNAMLSFVAKASTGYWRIFDPTNGYTAIHASSLRLIPLDKISRRYFFETDMLFRLGTIRAVVCDVPMDAVYAAEQSSLSPLRVFFPFLKGHLVNFTKRFVYSYLLRDFSVASVLTLIGLPMVLGGVVFGLMHWARSIQTGVPASSGTVMLAALPIVLGLQALLAALSYDIANVPAVPLQRLIGGDSRRRTDHPES
jgi:glycosyltransferase involved in cell wall biosynthesis